MIQLARLLLVAPLLGAAPLLAQTAAIAPGDNLVTDGIPPIPAGIAEVARRYGEFRAAAFWDWHPTRREMIIRSEEHTSELQSQSNLVCRLLLEKKKKKETNTVYCSDVSRVNMI